MPVERFVTEEGRPENAAGPGGHCRDRSPCRRDSGGGRRSLRPAERQWRGGIQLAERVPSSTERGRALLDSGLMNRRDRIAAEDLLRDYRLQLSLARGKYSFGQQDDPAEAMEAANRLLPKVNALMRILLPDTEPISGSSVSEHEAGVGRVLQAEDVLGDWDEMAGDDGETVQFGVPLNALDVVVLEAARQDWDQGKWRDAVANAAAKLNKYAQDRVGRHDISDSALMSEAFSPDDPKVGKPRLRCPGNPESETI